MRIRGDAYWKWADPTLHCRTHEEELGNGATIDVQVRLSRTGAAQYSSGCMPPPVWRSMKRLLTAGATNQ
ncbi:hypothetical protein D9M71_730170 [compost metagenome]